MWTIAFLFTTLGSGINMLLSLRRPSIVITAIVAQLLSFPLGKAWARWMPAWKWSVFGYTMHLNPGPFNIKEHTLIVVCIPSYIVLLTLLACFERQLWWRRGLCYRHSPLSICLLRPKLRRGVRF